MKHKSWFKTWQDRQLSDPDYLALPPAARGVLADLRCFAARTADHGSTGHTAESLVRWYGRNRRAVQSAVILLSQCGLIEVKMEDGLISIPRWDEAQETPAAARKRRQRAREKERDSHADVICNVTGEAEAEAEKKEEKKESTQDRVSNETIVPPELSGLSLYEGDTKLLTRWPELLHNWRRSHPDVDIAREIAKAHAWEIERPGRRKKDRAAYLGRWLRTASKDLGRQSAAQRQADKEWEDSFTRLRDSGELDRVEREAQRTGLAQEEAAPGAVEVRG